MTKYNKVLKKVFDYFPEWKTFSEEYLPKANSANEAQLPSFELSDSSKLMKSKTKIPKDQAFGEIAPNNSEVLAKMPKGFVSTALTRDELDRMSVITIDEHSKQFSPSNSEETLKLAEEEAKLD
jgi:hypothetical protein